MGKLGIRKIGESKLRLIDEQEYAKDHKEQNLHELIKANPELILREDQQGKTLPAITIGSHIRLDEVEADLLIADMSGSLFLVELKRGRAPRDIVAQILDYASRLRITGAEGLDALIKSNARFPEGAKNLFDSLLENNPDYKDSEYDNYDSFKGNLVNSITGRDLLLVVVSYSLDESVLAVIRYLRQVYEMNIYGVEFDYYSAENHEYFLPDFIGVEGRNAAPKNKASDMGQKYKVYWDKLLDELKMKLPGVTNQKGYPSNWMSIPIGYGGIHLEWAFHGNPRDSFEIGLHLERADVAENKRIFTELKQNSDKFEAEIGEKLHFQEKWGNKWSRIYTTRNGGELTDELKDWTVPTTVKFYQAFKPRLEAILKGG